MFQGLFNYDNPVWRFIGKLGDLILLNLLWTVCSIPVITIGASTTAVYYVTLKMVRDENDSTVRSFFHSFKDNFKQATAIWAIFLAVGLILAFDIWFFVTGQAPVPGIAGNLMTAISGGMAILYLFTYIYVFPIQARFYNPVKYTIRNAFIMSIRHLFQTVGIVCMDILIVIGAIASLFYMPQIFALFILFGMPLMAFANSYLFVPIFKRYSPKERDTQDMRPLFEEEDEATKEALDRLKNQ
ncbi:MAG: DUF624 domain-containing protein [Lachnospiraceae bacterium]|uniref:YesL family protein n=1 Tax=Candidatus Enterocloster excrementigallinarum TaxID=2838558 RepID=A0A9D2TF86_9FIRM|nr:DUF624 domain-containing protein [Lachnospiraceae bacterium]HJC66342.1 YesL family protein [Candidatus Enterocloster excrementigallinarum]